MAIYDSTPNGHAPTSPTHDDIPPWWASDPPSEPYPFPSLHPRADFIPAPSHLFYRDDMWQFQPAPPGSVDLADIDGTPDDILKRLLADSRPTVVPDHFVGAIHAHPCREWRGWREKRGYGVFFASQRGRPCTIRAHRARLMLRDGCLPTPDIHCRHLCNNPPCIEVSHLAWGTLEENTRDRAMKDALNWLQQVRTGNVAPAIAAEIRHAAIIFGLDIDGIQRLTRLPLATIEEIMAAGFTVL